MHSIAFARRVVVALLFLATAATALALARPAHAAPVAPTITGPPASPIGTRSDDSPKLTFTLGTGTSSVKCALDGATPLGCSSPWPLPAMSTGTHTLHVVAFDSGGSSTETTRQIAYAKVPDTTLNGSPAEGAIVNTPTTVFGWIGGDAPPACKLDDIFVACVSDLSAELSDGPHTFSVAAGTSLFSITYLDRTPALRHWTIDTHAPDTAISAGPSGSTTDRSPNFVFGGTDPGPGTTLHYMCRLDGGAWSACDGSGTQHYASLGAGLHSFDVKAIDAAGNVDPSPAVRSWIVIADADGDGYFTNTDCDDSNAAIHPGAVDTPGDRIDQDCSGADTPAPQPPANGAGNPSPSAPALASKLSASFKLAGKKTLVRKLVLSGVPNGARVRLSCRGKGCPFKSKTFRPKHGGVSLTRAFKHRKLVKNARLVITVTMPGEKKQVFTLTTRAGKKPKLKRA